MLRVGRVTSVMAAWLVLALGSLACGPAGTESSLDVHPAAVPPASTPSTPAQTSPPPKVVVSTGAMEGLRELSVQADVVGDADWRELVGLDREAVKKLAAEQLANVPGLTLLEKSPNAPRLVVNIVGHVIADDEGKKATAATHIWVRLSQRVAVHRDGMDEPILTTGATWQRAILSTGLKGTMRQRANDKLKYLLDQFRQDYVRVNPPE